MYHKVIQYCSKEKISVSGFESMCGLPNGTVQGWKKNDSSPTLNTILKIVSATNIPIETWTSGIEIKRKE